MPLAIFVHLRAGSGILGSLVDFPQIVRVVLDQVIRVVDQAMKVGKVDILGMLQISESEYTKERVSINRKQSNDICEKKRKTYPQHLDGMGSFSGTQRNALGADPVARAATCHSSTDLIFFGTSSPCSVLSEPAVAAATEAASSG